jgi:hypothetical protein
MCNLCERVVAHSWSSAQSNCDHDCGPSQGPSVLCVAQKAVVVRESSTADVCLRLVVVRAMFGLSVSLPGDCLSF